MEDTEQDELPEAVRLHKALAVAILGLELIAEGVVPGPIAASRTLKFLRENHPDAVEHIQVNNEGPPPRQETRRGEAG